MANVVKPEKIMGLHLFENGRDSKWEAVNYEIDAHDTWVTFEHPSFPPFDMRLHDLNLVQDMGSGKYYLVDKFA